MSLPYTKEQLTLVANTIRMLSADGVEKANSGHPGMPMGMADLGAVLWLKYLKFNPKKPDWLNRDRFVLSNGHGSMFLYSLLYLFGYDLSLDDLKSFRQWESKTPGHPESYMTAGVECTTGPLGQGVSNAVGMAIGEKILQSRYNSPAKELIDHQIFSFVGDGCLMEGVSSEACSLAGHLGLDNLIVIYDDNHISIAGHTELAFTESVTARFEAYGWYVQSADGHDFNSIDQAISNAVNEKTRPSLIAARTVIGKGSPNKADTHGVHGAALGKEELALTKKALNWPLEPAFFVPEEVRKIFADRVEQLTKQYAAWEEEYQIWRNQNADQASALERQIAHNVPKDILPRLIAALPKDKKPISTRKLSNLVLQAASKEVNSLIGGSADLEPSTLTEIKGSSCLSKESFSGLNIHFGVREHGMGAIMNGLSYYGCFIPYGSTFLTFSDYMRPPIRLAALSKIPGLFIFTHESVFLGEDGPTHQPIEHLNSLRMIPNLDVYRPADGLETAVCYAMALESKKRPSVLVFTRQNLAVIDRANDFDPETIKKGAYVVKESKGVPDVVFVATGSEVSLAIEAANLIEARSRVVSMPCWNHFARQSMAFKQSLIPVAAKKVVIEAGISLGWQEMIGGAPSDTLVIGIDRFGASAPAEVIAEELGFTPSAVRSRIKERFSL